MASSSSSPRLAHGFSEKTDEGVVWVVPRAHFSERIGEGVVWVVLRVCVSERSGEEGAIAVPRAQR